MRRVSNFEEEALHPEKFRTDDRSRYSATTKRQGHSRRMSKSCRKFIQPQVCLIVPLYKNKGHFFWAWSSHDGNGGTCRDQCWYRTRNFFVFVGYICGWLIILLAFCGGRRSFPVATYREPYASLHFLLNGEVCSRCKGLANVRQNMKYCVTAIMPSMTNMCGISSRKLRLLDEPAC